ncbi:MAG: DsrE family protein [Gemmatimonadota bacterium]|nr:DsrE family protein [Gemmatimonadota bacterium]MDH3422958.1 DsrE family protein [Gemmatimonadota bacterium]
MSTHSRVASLPWILAALTLVDPGAIEAQARAKAGPIVESAGAVFAVDPDLVTPTDRDYKVAFEIAAPASTPERMNASINTVARFLNMHAQAGVPAERLSAAIVAHGAASFELLNDEAYRARFGVDNPNSKLIAELIAADQPVILCGQSAASRGVPTDQLIPGVQVALSAMTAFLLLQDEGYRVNPW